MTRLFRQISTTSEVANFWLRQHVFPVPRSAKEGSAKEEAGVMMCVFGRFFHVLCMFLDWVGLRSVGIFLF